MHAYGKLKKPGRAHNNEHMKYASDAESGRKWSETEQTMFVTNELESEYLRVRSYIL